MFDHELDEFGRRMGMPAFGLDASGLAALDVDGLGRLYLEAADNGRELLLYVGLPVPAHDRERLARRALEWCDYRQAHALPVQGGVYGDRVLLLTRLPEGAVSAAGIENAVRFLAAGLERVTG